MNIDELKNRIKSIEEAMLKLTNDIRQAQANFNALEGKRAECLYWIDEINKPVVDNVN